MNVYEVVKNYNMLKNDMKKYVANKYDLESDEAEFESFDIFLDEQGRVVAKFTIKYFEPTMFKSDTVMFDDFMRKN